MKRIVVGTALALALTFGTTLAAYSAEHGGMQMDAKAGTETMTDHTKMLGVLIHESAVGTNKFAYHVLENKAGGEAMAGMNMGKPTKSHHLMLYPRDAAGKVLAGGKVGYLVTGPDGAKQQTMTMEMTGGYGADVDFSKKGKYEIKVKMVREGGQLTDTFSYEVK